MSLGPHSKQKMNDASIHWTKILSSSCEPMKVLGVVGMFGGEHGCRYMLRADGLTGDTDIIKWIEKER